MKQIEDNLPISPFELSGDVSASSRRRNAFNETIVGRRKELELLHQAVLSAFRGTGAVFTLSGEPGIGKTMLASEIAEVSASLGARVLWGRCWEGGGAPDYWPWIQILRTLAANLMSKFGALPELASSISHILRRMEGEPLEVVRSEYGRRQISTNDADTDAARRIRFALFQQICHHFEKAARSDPIVLILDDLHAADRSSLFLLKFLAPRLHIHKIVLIGTYRDTELKSSNELASFLETERAAQRLHLGGLSTEDLERLIQRRVGSPPGTEALNIIYKMTGGNPFFAGEILRQLPAGLNSFRFSLGQLKLPDGLSNAIRKQLEPLSSVCHEVLKIASVIGNEVPCQLLRLMFEGSMADFDNAIEEARTNEILLAVPKTSNFSFRHALFRETLYRELGPERRVGLHQRLGEILESAQETTNVKDSEIAFHFFEAFRGGAPINEKVVHYSSRAAEASVHALAYEEAANHYGRALEGIAWSNRESAQFASLALERGRALSRSGDNEQAKQAFWTALETAKIVKEPTLVGESVLELTGQWPSSAADGKLVAMLSESLAAVRQGDTSIKARLLSRLAAELYWSNRRTEMLDLSREAVEVAERLADPRALVYTWLHRRFALGGPDHPEELLQAVSRIRNIAQKRGNRELDLEATFWEIAHLLERGETSAVDLELATVAPIVREIHLPRLAWYSGLLRTTRMLQEGRFEEGERSANETLEIGNQVDPHLATLYHWSYLLVIRREQNRLKELEPLGRALVEQLPWFFPIRCELTFIWSEMGKHSEVASELEKMRSTGFSSLSRDALWFHSIALLAEACWTTKASAAATTLYDLLLPYGGVNICTGEGGVCLGSAERYLGLLAGAKGDRVSGIAHLSRAIDANSRMGATPWIARSYFDRGMLQMADEGSTHSEEAKESLNAASIFADASSMHHLRSLIEEHRKTPRESSARSKQGLFRREGDFWELSLDGGVIRLRNLLGLSYICRLLSRPDVEVHALDLLSRAEIATEDLLEQGNLSASLRQPLVAQLSEIKLRLERFGDAGEMLDAEAKAAYKRRRSELLEQLEESKEFGNEDAVAKVQAEIEALTKELARAVGLGGRDRRAGSSAERARLSVSRAIRVAINQIGEKDAALAHLLRATIRTGVFCCYHPDPKHIVTWQL